jgi:hypothetical protein
MTAFQLRKQVIEKVQNTDDLDLLEVLLGFLGNDARIDTPYELNEHQKKAIAISRMQIKNGEAYTQEEASKLTDEWLKD